MQTGRFAVGRWIGNITTSLTMPTLALLFLVALATAAGTHVLQLRLERWHYHRTLATEWTISDRRGLAPPPRPATSSCHPHPAGIPTICHGGAANGFIRATFQSSQHLSGSRRNVEPGAAADGRADPTTDMRGRGASGARTGSRCRQRGPAGAASTKPTAKTRTLCRCA